MHKLAPLLLLLAFTGCGHTPEPPDLRRFLTFQSFPDTNLGRPFYVVVREVDESQFLTQTYSSLARSTFPKSDDETTRAVHFATPGKREQVVVEVPEDKAFAIYALFTSPGDPWKVLLPPPLERSYHFVLDRGTIRQAPESKRRPPEKAERR
jgi:hypothetical protein